MQNSSDTVSLVRTISAPAHRVFTAWIDARQLERRLTQTAQTDARVGGRFRLEVRKDEATHVVAGESREIIPPRRIVKTWVYEGPYVPKGKMEALLTVEFRESGLNTEVILRHEGPTSPRYREAIQQGASDKAMDNLETLLSGCVTCQLLRGGAAVSQEQPPNNSTQLTALRAAADAERRAAGIAPDRRSACA